MKEIIYKSLVKLATLFLSLKTRREFLISYADQQFSLEQRELELSVTHRPRTEWKDCHTVSSQNRLYHTDYAEAQSYHNCEKHGLYN